MLVLTRPTGGEAPREVPDVAGMALLVNEMVCMCVRWVDGGVCD